MAKENNQKTISQAIIKRLPRYHRYLGDLEEKGIERISSAEFARMLGVTASQIRQDLNNFGGFGQQGYGYNVKYLRDEIGHILGIDHIHSGIIIGAGNLGKAIAGYKNFRRSGLEIRALFDQDESKIGTEIAGCPVYSMDKLKDYINDNNIEVAALTTSRNGADSIAEILNDSNIKGIWNFVHTDLPVRSDIYVENVHLSETFMHLCFNMTSKENAENV